jgi:DNA-binding CsgD family transcriptional regulator
MVLDGDGNIQFANAAAETICGRFNDGQPLTLRSIGEDGFAKERLDFLRESGATGRNVTVDGMIKGRYMRTTFRPLVGDTSDRRRVLMVIRPATPSPNGLPEGVVRARVDDDGPLADLTSRELEILRLIGSGLSTVEIAKRLHRSVKTVEWHRVSLGNKLGVANRVEIARVAINAGLVSADFVRTPAAE